MIQFLKKVDSALVEISSYEPNCWINIYPPFDQQELENISKRLNIPPDYFVDSLDVDEKSRYEREDNVDLIVLNTPIENPKDQQYDPSYITVPIGVISIPENIITICSYKSPIIDYFLNKNTRIIDPADHQDFILKIFDKTIYYFLVYLKRINHLSNQYEKELYNSSRNTELAKMMKLQKSLVYFVTTLRDNELLMLRIHRTDFIKIKDNELLTDYMDDIIVDSAQAKEMADIYNNILNGTMDAFASIISNNLNLVMKRLTSITIILMVPTLVASFYGMNVQLPLAQNEYAFMYAAIISVLLSFIVVFLFFRSKVF